MSDPVTPNMSLIQPVTGVTPGSTANDDYNSNWTNIDQHDHTPGRGVQLSLSSLNITADFSLSGYNLTTARSARFSVQPSALALATDLACIYFSGVDLWANDASGNQIQITSGGGINATSSGISSGTATASFVSSVLVVNASSNKPANIQGASLLIGNNVVNSKYLTLSPPNAMAADYGLVLPPIPGVNSIMGIDTSGNITGAYTVDNSSIEINGSSQIAMKAQGTTWTKRFTRVVATGAGSVGQIVLSSSSSGSFSQVVNSFTDVTNLTVQLATNGGPVRLSLVPATDGSPGYVQSGTSNGCFFKYLNTTNSHFYTTGGVTGGGVTAPPSGVVDYSIAGSASTYTWKVQVENNNTGSTVSVMNLLLMAEEIG